MLTSFGDRKIERLQPDAARNCDLVSSVAVYSFKIDAFVARASVGRVNGHCNVAARLANEPMALSFS
jgi:hypothetical protein